MSDRRIPQFLVLFFLGLQAVSAVVLHKTPREPLYDGGDLFFTALLFFCLLAWGGFWDRKS